MARMPGARWLGEQSPRNPMDRYDIVCVHTIVGYAPAHAAHFSVHADGTIDQSRDTAYESAANLNGNGRIIAIENEDHGDAFGPWSGSNVPPLTDAQVKANADILAWAHREHGIPLKLCPSSRARARGLAYHRQGIDGNFGGYAFPGRVPGGEIWTEHYGKVCPGDHRIAQLPDILALAKGGTLEEDMPLNDDDLKRIANHVWSDEMGGKGNRHSARHHLIRAANASMDNRRLLQTIPDQIADAVATDVQNDLDAGGGIEPVELRRIVRVQATRAMTELLGALDEPAE